MSSLMDRRLKTITWQDVPGVMVERWWSRAPKDRDGSYEYWKSEGFALVGYEALEDGVFFYVMVKAR